ncbi:hypothetical protein SADUNF_Sadunf16G0272900 [Salix dunnii]|uniref:Apple domain-containing protein n=1 Tax=Salix dunnii TaxID=1413687 RepID=A0A835MHN7_9ROSI|nr:hypothetical protein SADUNF_Sadunf16G0272900 [Salix dunnii]
MKYGISLVTGLNRYLTSWKSPSDPSTGQYTNKLDPNGLPQYFLSKGSVDQFRSGPWNGLRFSGMINLKPNPIYTFEFVFSQEEIYYKYQIANSSVLSRMVLSPDGVLQRFTWIDRTQDWNLYLTANMDNCDRFALCGAHGVCNINNSPACDCLTEFEPKSLEDWTTADWTQGCVRKVPLDCSNGEGFIKYTGIKVPDTRKSWYSKTMNLEECEVVCLKNCSCTAYANLDVRDGGSGCVLWFGDLIDIRQYNENGQDIYIRMAASVIDKRGKSRGKKQVRIIVIPISLLAFFLLALCLFLRFLRKNRTQQLTGEEHNLNLLGHAWMLHKEGRPLDLIDESIVDTCIISEVLRSIEVALLCVQKSPEDRPKMSNVVLMLSSDIVLPQPKEPGFFTERDLSNDSSSTIKHETSSVNELTSTLLEAR